MAYIEMVHSFKRCHMGDITITANNDVSSVSYTHLTLPTTERV